MSPEKLQVNKGQNLDKNKLVEEASLALARILVEFLDEQAAKSSNGDTKQIET